MGQKDDVALELCSYGKNLASRHGVNGALRQLMAPIIGLL